MLAHDHSPGFKFDLVKNRGLVCCSATRPGVAFCCSENVKMLAKILTKGYRIYIHILFFAVIEIGYNILFWGLDMDRI
jgi:hypothetical protein